MHTSGMIGMLALLGLIGLLLLEGCIAFVTGYYTGKKGKFHD